MLFELFKDLSSKIIYHAYSLEETKKTRGNTCADVPEKSKPDMTVTGLTLLLLSRLRIHERYSADPSTNGNANTSGTSDNAP
ncbi:MAG: hypothetical protein M1540_06305 [Candidatus Bathyarchaeota archaeon]|nr:hypothetical protein [Candidatus Bathyarchaeota archaeon]